MFAGVFEVYLYICTKIGFHAHVLYEVGRKGSDLLRECMILISSRIVYYTYYYMYISIYHHLEFTLSP